eukprot:COSAG05_NODE_809_length_7187_cov_20.173109_3_plen_1294_part_00
MDTTDYTSVVVDQTKPTLAISIESSNPAQQTIARRDYHPPTGWDDKRNMATTNDTVTLTVTADEFIYEPTVTFWSNGSAIGDATIDYNDTQNLSQFTANKVWTCRFICNATDVDGNVSFMVVFEDAAGNAGIDATSVTDGSSVITDQTKPRLTLVSIASSNEARQRIINITSAIPNTSRALDRSKYSIHLYDVLPTVEYFTEPGMPQGTRSNACTLDLLGQFRCQHKWDTGTNVGTVGDNITLSIYASEFIYRPTCTFFVENKRTDEVTKVDIHDNDGQQRIFAINTVDDPGLWTCTYTVLPQDIDGPISFTASGFVDAAFNTLPTTSNTTTDSPQSNVALDMSKPTLSAVTSISDNAALDSAATKGDKIVLSFTADQEIFAPICQFTSGGQPVQGRVNVSIPAIDNGINDFSQVQYKCSYTVRVNDTTEGPVPDPPGLSEFTIRYRDIAGNEGEVVDEVLGSSLKVLSPCRGSFCMHKDNDWRRISGRNAPLCGSNCDQTKCFKEYFTIGTGVETCNPSHPFLGDDQFCMYGPQYIHLGLECRMCPHPFVVDELRTRCVACPIGQGPNVLHDGCVPCFEGSTSAFGVCQPCPAGSTSNDARTECVNINECDTNDGGCDGLAVFGGGPCIDKPHTGAGYECGLCPEGFITITLYADYNVTRKMTHGNTEIVFVAKRIHGNRCDLPVSPPPPPGGDTAEAKAPTVQPKFLLNLQNSTCDPDQLPRLRRHIAESVEADLETIDKLQCQSGIATRRLSTANISDAAAARAQLQFILKAADADQSLEITRQIIRQMMDPDSSLLHSAELAVTTAMPSFQCPPGSTLSDSQQECIRCAKGKYNPKHAGRCESCPPDQTSTAPYYSCHCSPGLFNATYVNIRCFEPNMPYVHSYALTSDKEPPDCAWSTEGVWRGNDCCKLCPEPTDQSAPLPADYPYDQHMCVDCTKIGNTVNEFGEPTGDHGIMIPRIVVGWDQSSTGKTRSLPGVDPMLGALGPSGAGNGGKGDIVELNRKLSSQCQDRDPDACFVVEPETSNPVPGQLGTVVELNIFRCPFQTNADEGVTGSCLGQLQLVSNTSEGLNSTLALNSTETDSEVGYHNTTECAPGYGGVLCGWCVNGYVMTNAGCKLCGASALMEAVWFGSGVLILVVVLILVIRWVKNRAEEDDSSSDEDTEVDAKATIQSKQDPKQQDPKQEREEPDTLNESPPASGATESKSQDQATVPTPKSTGASMWRKARLVKHAVSFQMTAELEAIRSQIGLEDMQAALDDAQTLIGMFKTGISRGQTQIKISIGLTQIL